MVQQQVAKLILSRLAWTQIGESINMINVRLKVLQNTFGRNSSVIKNLMAFMQKGSLYQYMGTSKAGNIKVDYMAIKRAVTSGRLGANELNEILTKLAGTKVNENGEVERVNSRVPTLNKLQQEAKAKMQEMGIDPEEYGINKFIEEMANFSSEFQSSYNTAVKDVGAEKMENDPIVGQLWSENRPHDGRLSYSDLRNIMKRMKELRADAVMQEGWVENNEDIPF